MKTSSIPKMILLGALVSACATDVSREPAEESTRTIAAPLFDQLFVIQRLGDRCLDIATTTRPGPGTALVINSCSGRSKAQRWRIQELDAETHDIRLMHPSTGLCAGLAKDPARDVAVELQTCDGSQRQRFAFDGDALMAGTSEKLARVTRDWALGAYRASTNVGTPVVLGTRELVDDEYWRMTAADLSGAKPHSGFVTATSAAELARILPRATWGTVVELASKTDSISLPRPSSFLEYVVREGVTLRGGRKGLWNGVELRLEKAAIPPYDPDGYNQYWALSVHDHARITGLRLRGPSRDEAGEKEPRASGILVQEPSYQTYPHNPFKAGPIQTVFIDHNDLSDWTNAAVDVALTYVDIAQDASFDCPNDFIPTPHVLVAGNFVHDKHYGVAVGGGAYARVTGNLMFAAGHQVTSDGYAHNQYDALDNLFTSEKTHYENQELDVHGVCSPAGEGKWTGGRAGGRYEMGFNTFLAERPMVQVRGTPCREVSFHDNLRRYDLGDPKTDTKVHLGSFPAACWTFDAGTEETIFAYANNDTIEDPTRELGVGDFDGDGVDDVFLGTGNTWWYSAGGKAEWRFLNRMPERASALRFGDFDADGRTDILRLRDKTLEVSWAGGSPWNVVGEVDAQIEDVAVAELDGLPGADIFVADGTMFRYFSAGRGNPLFYAYSTYRTKELRFGDFTGDKIVDIFSIQSTGWKIVTGPGLGWVTLGPARSTNIEELVVADFDGDDLADVARSRIDAQTYSVRWSLAKSGVHDYTLLQTRPVPQVMWATAVGRFDPTPGADVLFWDTTSAKKTAWFQIASGGEGDVLWSRQSMR